MYNGFPNTSQVITRNRFGRPGKRHLRLGFQSQYTPHPQCTEHVQRSVCVNCNNDAAVQAREELQVPPRKFGAKKSDC